MPVKRIVTCLPAILLLLVGSPDPSSSTPRVRTVSSDGQGVVLLFEAGEFLIEEVRAQGAAYVKVELPGAGRTSREGFPLLPMQGLLVGLPEEASPSVRILEADYRDRTDSLVLPCPRRLLREEAGRQRWVEEPFRQGEAYRSDATFPGLLVELRDAGRLRGLRVARLLLHPAQANSARRELRLFSRIKFRVEYGAPAALGGTQTGADREPDPYERILEERVVNYEAIRDLPRRPAACASGDLAGGPVVVRSAGGPGPNVKLGVDRPGVYRVGYEDLVAAGYDPASVDPRNVHVESRGVEVPIHLAGEADGVFDPGDYLLFYGRPVDTIYTGRNVYWLYADGAAGLRIQERSVSPGGTAVPLTSFRNRTRKEENLVYYQNPEGGGEADYWYWDRLNAPTEKTYGIHLENVSTEAGTASLRIGLKGSTNAALDPDHHTRVVLNGSPVDDAYWDGFVEYVHEIAIPQSLLLEGDNTVVLSAPGDTGSEVDGFYTNWIEIDYLDSFEAEGDLLAFNGEGEGTFRFDIAGFSTDDLEAFDLSDPHDPVRLTGFGVLPDGEGTILSFEDALEGRSDYLALALNRSEAPVSIALDTPSDLRSIVNGADYIAVTTEELAGAALTLADHRSSKGLRAQVVLVEDIYDEFNHGILDPQAIKDFLVYAYRNWAPPAPAYVVLVGDASYDFRDYLGYDPGEPVPPFMVHRMPTGQRPTDHPFACVSGGDDLPDLFLGRISTPCPIAAAEIVAKLIAYEGLEPSLWMRRTLFAADEGEEFRNVCEAMIQETIPGHYLPRRIYMDDYLSPKTAGTELKLAINHGALLTSFTGHGSSVGWAYHLLNMEDLHELQNDDHWTFVIVASCNSGFFVHPAYPLTFSELFLHYRERGAIGVFSPIGVSGLYGDAAVGTALLEQLFVHRTLELGPATAAAKISAYANHGVGSDVLENYEYFGDPALALKVEDPAADSDEDGYINEEDNCPFTVNADQQDADGDDWGDVCDNCPFAWNPDQIDRDTDGLGDVCDEAPVPPDCLMEAVFSGAGAQERLNVLRTFRNRHLSRSEAGRAVVAAYDRLCRPLAEAVQPLEGVRMLLRLLLMPLVGFASLFQ